MSRRRKLPLASRAIPDYRIVDTSINYRRIEEIRSLYFIPESYSIRVPNKGEKMHCPPQKFQTVHVAAFMAGLRFPLHSFVEDLLLRLNLSLTQLNPNCHRHLVSFIILMRYFNQEICFENFFSLYELQPSITSGPGFFYFRPQQHLNHKFLHNVKNSYGNWKPEFFYIRPPIDRPWRIPTNWNLDPPSPVNMVATWDKDFLSHFLTKYYDSEKLVTSNSLQITGLCASKFASGKLTLDEMVKQSEINKYQAISEKKKKELEKASGAATRKRPSVKGLTKQQKKAKATPDDTSSEASADASETSNETSKDDRATELYETMARKCHREPVDQTPTARGPSASLSEQEVDSELQFSTPPTSTTTLLDQGTMKEKEEEVKEDDLHILEHWPGTKICTDPNDKLCLFTVFSRPEGKDKVLDNDAPAPANPKPALETSKLMQSPMAATSSVPSVPKMAPPPVAQVPSIPTVYSSSLTELKAMLSQLVLPFTPHRLREIREQFVAMDRENISTICHTRKTFLLVLARELASMKLPEALAKDYAPWPKQLESILQTCTENLPVVETPYHPQEDDAQEELRKVTDRIDLCASRASDYAVSERQIMSRLEPAKAEVERLQAELSRAQAVLAQVEADLGQLEVDRANHAEEEQALRDVAAQTIKALMKAKRADKLHDIEYNRARNTLDAAAEQLRQFVDQFRRDFLGLTSSSNGIQATPSPVTPSVTRPAEDATPKPSEGDN